MTKLPLDGNPFNTMGIIGHPGAVSNVVCSPDGKTLITTGGIDGIINFWSIHPEVLEAQASISANSLDPFLNMIDPSGLAEQGPIYREFEDYFYYAQLRG